MIYLDKLDEIHKIIIDLCESRCYVKGQGCNRCVLQKFREIIERKDE